MYVVDGAVVAWMCLLSEFSPPKACSLVDPVQHQVSSPHSGPSKYYLFATSLISTLSQKDTLPFLGLQDVLFRYDHNLSVLGVIFIFLSLRLQSEHQIRVSVQRTAIYNVVVAVTVLVRSRGGRLDKDIVDLAWKRYVWCLQSEAGRICALGDHCAFANANMGDWHMLTWHQGVDPIDLLLDTSVVRLYGTEDHTAWLSSIEGNVDQGSLRVGIDLMVALNVRDCC